MALGYDRLQWEGNNKADQAATASLHFRRPPYASVKERRESLADLNLAQLVAVSVHEAHLACAYPASAPKTRRKRRRRFALTLRSIPTIRIHRHRPPRIPLGNIQWAGVHHLQYPDTPRAPSWGAGPWPVVAKCTLCGLTGRNTAAWTWLALTPCLGRLPTGAPAGQPRVDELRPQLHELLPDGARFPLQILLPGGTRSQSG